MNYELRIEYEKLIKEELNVKKIKTVKGSGEISVELDTQISDELKLEGLKRELVRTVNAMRKEAGLTIKDRINLSWHSESDLIKQVFVQLGEEIKKDILCERISGGEDAEGEEIMLNNEKVNLNIIKL